MNTDPSQKIFADAPKANSPTPSTGPLLMVGGVANLLNRCPSTIREIAADIGLPDVRAGNVRVFNAAAIEKLRTEIQRREREALR